MSAAPPNSGRIDSLAIVRDLHVVSDAPERFEDRAAAIDTLHVSAWIALEESEERLQLATDGAGAGVWDHDFTTMKFVWSERHCAMLGYAADVEPSFELWRSLVDPDDLDAALAEFSRARESKTQFRACYRIRRADTGDERWIEDVGRYFYGEGGKAVRCAGIILDISEKKRAEDALRAAREDLAAELAATKLLQAISCELVREDNVEALYDKILHAATVVMRSDFASMQMLFPERGAAGEMKLLGGRGFSAEALQFWEWVRADSLSACAMAMTSGRRCIIPEIEACDFMAGTPEQQAHLDAGFRAVQSTPLFSRAGKLVGMISTHWKEPHNPSNRDLALFDVLARQASDLIERREAEALNEANRRSYAELIERSPFGVYVVDSGFRIAHANAEARDVAFINVRPMIGRDFSEAVRILWPEAVAAIVIAAFRGTLDTGEPYVSKDYRFPRADVEATEAYEWELHRTTLPDGRYAVICYYYDSSKLRDTEAALRDAQRRQKLLLDELNHRVKNTLATVQSIAVMTLRNANTNEGAGADFTARLVSLSNAHNILTREHWEGAEISDVVRSALSPYSDEKRARFRLDGPPLRLRPKSALALSLALHELATNAIKHGSLSEGDGRVDIVWKTAGGRFRFYWTESSGPNVAPPRRKGFGSRLLQEGIASDLGGEAELRFEPDGVVCKISAPLEEISGPA